MAPASSWASETPFPPDRRYPPWEFMLHVDEVNYSLSEQLHVIANGHEPLINLASGVNFVPPPSMLIEEAIRALACPVFYQDYDGYTGHAVGRRAIQCYESTRSERGIDLSDEHVMITCGAGAALHLLSLYFGDAFKGGGMLTPVPTFPLAGATMKAVGLEVQEVGHAGSGRFLPTVDELEAAITERTRLIYVNIFNNPTGECYSQQEFAKLVTLAKQRDMVVIVDRVSSDLDVTDSLPNVLDIAAEQAYLDGIVVVSSLSKDRGLPGLRVGWIIGPPQLIEHLADYNSLIAMSSPTFGGAVLYVDMLCRAILHKQHPDMESMSQQASTIATQFYERTIPVAALTPDLRSFLNPLRDPLRVEALVEQYAAWQRRLRQLLRRNWEILRDEYGQVYVGTCEWKGDFNTFVHVPALDGASVYETTIQMFRRQGLQILPGPVFGCDTAYWQRLGFWTRLSFALPTPQWRQGLSVLARFAESAAADRP